MRKSPSPPIKWSCRKNRNRVRGDGFFSGIHAGIVATGAKMSGGLDEIAKYGTGAALDFSGEVRDVRGLVLHDVIIHAYVPEIPCQFR